MLRLGKTQWQTAEAVVAALGARSCRSPPGTGDWDDRNSAVAYLGSDARVKAMSLLPRDDTSRSFRHVGVPMIHATYTMPSSPRASRIDPAAAMKKMAMISLSRNALTPRQSARSRLRPKRSPFKHRRMVRSHAIERAC